MFSWLPIKHPGGGTLDLESDQCCWLNRFIKKPPSRNQTQQKLISLDISWSNAMCSCTIYPWYMLILDKAIQWWSPDSATSTSTTHQNGTKAKHTFTHQKHPEVAIPIFGCPRNCASAFVTGSRPKRIFGSRHSYYTVRCPKPYCTCRVSIGSFFSQELIKALCVILGKRQILRLWWVVGKMKP